MRSIRRELLAALIGTLCLALAGGAFAIYHAALEEVDELFDYQLRQLALSLRDQAFHNTFAAPVDSEDEPMDFVIQVWDPAGVRVYYSHPHRALPGLLPAGYSTIDTPEGAWRVFSARLYKEAIQVAQPMSVRNRMALTTAYHLMLPLLLLLPVLSIFIWVIVSRGLAPLKRLARAVSSRTATVLDPLPEQNAPQEVLPLVKSLNDLLGRLAEAIKAQKAFIADAAHELRTPIAALQLQVQLLEGSNSAEETQAGLDDLKAGVRRASRTVQQLLTLARQEPDVAAPARLHVGLAELTRQVVAEMSALAAAKPVDLGLSEVDEAAFVDSDPEGLRALLGNLVENAVRYTPAGGRVDVSVLQANGMLGVQVQDTGPGIPEEDLARVFDRFYRGQGTLEPGTGLGLAIVKTIADRLGAEVSLKNRPDGGLRACLWLPDVRRKIGRSISEKH